MIEIIQTESNEFKIKFEASNFVDAQFLYNEIFPLINKHNMMENKFADGQ